MPRGVARGEIDGHRARRPVEVRSVHTLATNQEVAPGSTHVRIAALSPAKVVRLRTAGEMVVTCASEHTSRPVPPRSEWAPKILETMTSAASTVRGSPYETSVTPRRFTAVTRALYSLGHQTIGGGGEQDMDLQQGTNKEEQARLSMEEIADELVKQEHERPIVLNEEEYREWLNHTVLARLERGENHLERVRELVSKAAKSGGDGQHLEAVVEELDRAVVAFQYVPLKANVMYRPSIDGRPASNVVLWPIPE